MSDQPGWLKVALGAGVGFLCGVVLIVVLALANGDGATTPERQRTATGVAVPHVVGLRLDAARERLERDGFAVEHEGGGLLGVVVESNWEVDAQDPAAGARRARGATVVVHVARP